MKVLFVKDDPFHYIAKIYWSLQKGLRASCDLKTYGLKQDFFDPEITSYQQMLRLCYGADQPDAVITNYNYNECKFRFTGIENYSGTTVVIIGDYWDIKDRKTFISQMHGVDVILSLFYEFSEFYPELAEKIVFCPPSVDMDLFKDWKLPKTHTVGFLGSGCHRKTRFYADRLELTKHLTTVFGDDFYTEQHPGWGFFPKEKRLIGAGFSKAINGCKAFVSTAGSLGHCNPKYYEIMASGSLLLAGPAKHLDKSHFIDGENCIFFQGKEDLVRKVNFYNNDEAKMKEIVEGGLNTIKKYHSSEVRGKEVVRTLQKFVH